MKTSSYNSVPVIASIIGSKSRKAMYLTNITSLDGKRIYKDKWIPTSWNTNTKYEWRYTNKERGINNALVEVSRYYKFHMKDSVLMTDKGAVNKWGALMDVTGLSKVTIANSKQTVEWEYHSQSLIEFPMKRVSQAMVIDTHDRYNVSNIKSKLVEGKVVDYLQLKDKYIIHIPTWLIRNFEQRMSIRKVEEVDTFANDTLFHGVAEQTQIESMEQEEYSYIDRREMNFESIDSLTQWEKDNPEYASY